MSRYLPQDHAITDPFSSQQMVKEVEYAVFMRSTVLVPELAAMLFIRDDLTETASHHFDGTWVQSWRLR